jgi:hypothetical protein
MLESRILQEKKNNLPAIVTVPGTLSTKSRVVGALAIFAPPAVEVVYGPTRKWLSGATGDLSSQASEKEAKKNQPVYGSSGGFQRRFRGSR